MKGKTMITKRQWEEMHKTDSFHVLKLEEENKIFYELKRYYYFLKHFFIKNKNKTL
jgi:hypothetical protein